MRLLSFFAFLFVFTYFPTFVDGAAPSSSPKDIITTRALSEADKSWFLKEFVRSFMSVYKDKTFVITKANQPKILGPEAVKDKQEWLEETAKEEFQDYITARKEGYKAVLIIYNGQPVGGLLYRLLEEGKTIYLAQYFISPEQQKKGIAYRVLAEIIPKLHPDYKRYDVLTRQQNDAAFLLYRKLEFTLGDIEIVKKYDYDPLRYVSFYKVLS